MINCGRLGGAWHTASSSSASQLLGGWTVSIVPLSVQWSPLWQLHSSVERIKGDLVFYFINLFLIKFIGVILVHKIIQVSSIQLNKTSSAHFSMHPSPQAKSLSIPISFPLPTSTYPHLPSRLAITTLSSVSMHYVCVFWLIPSPSFIQSLNLPPFWELPVCSMCPCLCFYLVCQFVLFIRFHI